MKCPKCKSEIIEYIEDISEYVELWVCLECSNEFSNAEAIYEEKVEGSN